MNVLVFCSAYNLDEKYSKPAVEFAGMLGKNHHDLVWGGSNVGLMEKVATAAQNSGSKIRGVSIVIYHPTARKNADEMIVAKTLGERKSTMLEMSDAIVVMPGGIGTLDEITEVLELKKQHHHAKPLVVLNTDNFYDGLKMQFEKMDHEGFLPQSLESLIYFAETPGQAMDYINENFKTGK